MTEQEIKVLIIDDNLALLETLSAGLECEGFKVVTAPDGKNGLDKVYNETPAVVLLDVNLPDRNGFDICRDIKRNTQTAGISIIMMTGDETVDIDKGFAVGADDCIIKPVDVGALSRRIMKLVKTKDRVLVVEDDRQIADVLTSIIMKHGCDIQVHSDGVNLIEKVKAYSPDIILLDISLGIPPDGIELCRQLKNDQATKAIPILMLTANECSHSIDKSFEHGAEDYIFKPFSVPELLAKIKSTLALAKRQEKSNG